MSGPDREQVAEALFRWNWPDPYFVILGRAGDAPADDAYAPIADAVIEVFSPALQAARDESWVEYVPIELVDRIVARLLFGSRDDLLLANEVNTLLGASARRRAES